MPNPDQYMAALANGNRIRLRLKGIREELREGEISLVDAFELPEFQSAKIGQILMCLPRVGPKKAGEMLREAGVMFGDRKVRDLSPRQIWVLCETAEERSYV